MSNARQETIADIVADMREFADADSQTIGRDVLRRRIQHFARRFVAAAMREREAGAAAAQIGGEIGEMVEREAVGKETVTDCNGLGNAAKMRDVIHEVQANEKDDIVVHKLAEIAADCAWCEREYGEAER